MLSITGLACNAGIGRQHRSNLASSVATSYKPIIRSQSPLYTLSKPYKTHNKTNKPLTACQANATSNQQQSTPPSTSTSDGPVIVWFKHDLRIDDHPGLHAALASGKGIVPVFVYDPSVYHAIVQSPSTASALSKAVASLQQSLRSLGSDLLITTGSWTDTLPTLATSFNASSIITEEEIETAWRHSVTTVQNVLPSNGTTISFWTAPLYESYPTDDFKDLKRSKPVLCTPLDPPTQLPSLPPTTSTTTNTMNELPSPEELLALADQHRISTLHPTLKAAYQSQFNTSSTTTTNFGNFSGSFSDEESTAAGRLINAITDTSPENATWPGDDPSSNGNGNGNNIPVPLPLPFVNNHNSNKPHVNVEEELAAEIATGQGPVLGALRSYLSFIETSADAGGSSWHWKIGPAIAKFDLPATPEGCFPAIFGRALSLGVVSRRRVFAEAKNTLRQQGSNNSSDWTPDPGNLFQQLGYLLTSSGGASLRRKRQKKAAAAALAAEAGDFHVALAHQREGQTLHDGATLCHFRWRGILTDYLVAQPPPGKALPNAPAIMLVHGFGAFGEHWRYNVAALAQAGFTVYAPTFPGYGRAEKPVVPYGQDLWRDFLAGFVDGVVKRPVVVAGNSIGGFISASLAADYPGRVEGLILVNSAGLLQENYTPPDTPPTPPSPPLFVVEGVSRALFAFLEGGVEKQLKRVYPVAPEQADAWLAQEISRSARDPGALGVFRSVFYLPKPRALNWLVEKAFGGPTLVLQGGKDPLNDAVGRAKELDRLCGNAEVVLLNAGHCPHDEVPEIVNEKIKEFVLKSVMKTESKVPAVNA